MRSPSRCVVLFARAPRAEARLKGLPAAEPLFQAMGHRIRSAVARLPGVDLLRCGPDTLAAGGVRAIAQRGAGFASRLANAFADARALGYERVVVVPGDVPGLDERAIARAFARLRTASVVLGPSPDGGVYLIGCRGPAEGLLRDVRWCTPHVTRDLLANASDAALLPRLADVDRARDLSRVRRDHDVAADLRALIAAPRPATALAFESIALRSRGAGAPDPSRGPPALLPPS